MTVKELRYDRKKIFRPQIARREGMDVERDSWECVTWEAVHRTVFDDPLPQFAVIVLLIKEGQNKQLPPIRHYGFVPSSFEVYTPISIRIVGATQDAC